MYIYKLLFEVFRALGYSFAPGPENLRTGPDGGAHDVMAAEAAACMAGGAQGGLRGGCLDWRAGSRWSDGGHGDVAGILQGRVRSVNSCVMSGPISGDA
jgi:hypothetical protein